MFGAAPKEDLLAIRSRLQNRAIFLEEQASPAVPAFDKMDEKEGE